MGFVVFTRFLTGEIRGNLDKTTAYSQNFLDWTKNTYQYAIDKIVQGAYYETSKEANDNGNSENP